MKHQQTTTTTTKHTQKKGKGKATMMMTVSSTSCRLVQTRNDDEDTEGRANYMVRSARVESRRRNYYFVRLASSCQYKEAVKIYISTCLLRMVCCFNKGIKQKREEGEILPFSSPHTQTIRQETDRHRWAAASNETIVSSSRVAAAAPGIDVVITQLRRRRRQRLPVEPMILK